MRSGYLPSLPTHPWLWPPSCCPRPGGRCWLREQEFLSLIPALSASASVVFFADEFVEAHLRPLGVKLHFEILAPGRSEDFGIVDRHLVGDRVCIDAPQSLDGVEGVGVHAIVRGIDVVGIVKEPSLE